MSKFVKMPPFLPSPSMLVAMMSEAKFGPFYGKPRSMAWHTRHDNQTETNTCSRARVTSAENENEKFVLINMNYGE